MMQAWADFLHGLRRNGQVYSMRHTDPDAAP